MMFLVPLYAPVRSYVYMKAIHNGSAVSREVMQSIRRKYVGCVKLDNIYDIIFHSRNAELIRNIINLQRMYQIIKQNIKNVH